MQWKEKFINYLCELKEQGKIPCLIFCINPKVNEGFFGVLLELLQVVYQAQSLREFCIVLIHKDAKAPEDIDFFPESHIIRYDGEPPMDKVISHLNGEEGYVRFTVLGERAKHINTQKTLLEKKEVQE
jgi:hypothetical protein